MQQYCMYAIRYGTPTIGLYIKRSISIQKSDNVIVIESPDYEVVFKKRYIYIIN